MVGMRYPIDAVWVDGAGKVVHVDSLKPWQFSRWVRQAKGVLELPAGQLAATDTQVGDFLRLEERN